MPDCPAKPSQSYDGLFCDNFQEICESAQKKTLALTEIEVNEARFLDFYGVNHRKKMFGCNLH